MIRIPFRDLLAVYFDDYFTEVRYEIESRVDPFGRVELTSENHGVFGFAIRGTPDPLDGIAAICQVAASDGK